MKRILPIILVLALVLTTFLSCAPKKETKDEGKKEPAATAKKTTTSKHIDMGISDSDVGWSYWTMY